MRGAAVRRRLFVLLAAVIIAAGPLPACPDPVFRVLLANGAADRYVVLIYHRGDLTGEAKRALDLLQRRGKERVPANIVVRTIDLDQEPDERMLEIWDRQDATELPWMVVLFPVQYGITAPALSRPLGMEAVSAMLASPFRRQLAQRILAGHAAVWVLLESGNAEKDAGAARLLSTTLKALDSSLLLTDDTEEFARRMNINYTIHPSQGKYSDFDIRFAMMRLSRDDPRERFLVRSLEMLWSSGTDFESVPAAKAEDPALFIIFARGNVREPLIGRAVTEQDIEVHCRVVISSCSCVTDPREYGRNLLMAANWRAAVSEEMSPDEAAALPALTGFTASPSGTDLKSAPAAEPAEQQTWGVLLRNIAVVGVAAAFLVAIISYVVLRRRAHS